jgi:hypothetical protein
MLACCGAQKHPWNTFSVRAKWMPDKLRCLIVGESPGGDPKKYFYNQHQKVAVKTIMLRELCRHGLIVEPTLPAFRKAGFLFDHAIRCLLPPDMILHEAELAKRYESSLAATPRHLRAFLANGSPVWVMGYLARNAVALKCPEFPRDTSPISEPPNPRQLPEAPRFFVSRYLLHASRAQVAQIFRRLHSALDKHSAAKCDACARRIRRK